MAGVHTLITGLNGHGKTLLLVADKLMPLVGAKLDLGNGRSVPRRIVVHGVPGLGLPHELMACPEVDPEKFVDEWRDHEREPGTPPVEGIEWQVQNWWLWVQPGDVLVIDEAQGAFPAMVSGRRIPTYVRKLNVARHYGVQFVYLTQFPAMLHANLRALVGPHEDVRRIFGGVRTVVYQWDRVNASLNVKSATKRVWKHDRRAFGVYRSAQAHTNFRQRLPFAVFGLVGGLAVLSVAGWFAYGRIWGGDDAQARAARERSAVGAPASGGATVPGPVGGWSPSGQAVRPRVLSVAPAVRDREPYGGLGVHIAGQSDSGGHVRTWFTLSVDGRAVGTVSDRELQRAGYGWRTHGTPCSGVLIFGGQERAVTCDAPVPERVRDERQPQQQGVGVVAPASSAPGLLG